MKTAPIVSKLTKPHVVIPGFLILFGLIFLPLQSTIGDGAFILSGVFPLVAGLLIGLRCGCLYWFLHSVMLCILAPMAGQTTDDLVSTGLTMYFVTLMLTLSVGRISDLTKALRGELNERKKFEKELQLYKDELEELVAQRTAALKESNEQLKREIVERERANKEKMHLEVSLKRAEKMEAVGILAGSVAHDLNNILSGILNYPELILLDMPKDSPLRKPILTIKQSGERAAAVVQDLLTLARRGIVDAQTVDMNKVLSNFLQSPEHQNLLAEYPEMTVETDLQPNLFRMVGSPVHLSKMVMNLVANAIESMAPGGRLSISTKNVYIDKSDGLYEVPEEGEYVAVQFADSGEGIAIEDLEKIFEPFYTNKVMGRSGTGLGLAIVWGTVKDHRGYVDVRSEIGKGTVFTLYFPGTRDNEDVTEEPWELEKYCGNGETILIVDDTELQRNICSSILEKLRYKVTSVSSGEEAIEYLRKRPVDLLVLDMIMPGHMDGLETYEKVVTIQPGLKAIIVSGFAQSERVETALALGVGGYVRKPYTIEQLAVVVKNELGSDRSKGVDQGTKFSNF